MKRSHLLSVATLLVASVALGCGDSRTSLPTDPLTSGEASRASVPGTCTTLANLTALTRTVFSAGSPDANSVLGKLDNLDKQLKRGNLAEAQAQANNIVAYVQAKAAAGRLVGTRAQVQLLINGVLCYAGLLDNTVLVYPSDQPQVVTDKSGQAGISLPANPVDVPTLITLKLLDPAGPSPLITKLDKYPGYLEITSSSSLARPAVVAVCPSVSVPAEVVGRLRLGHQGSAGFEITPPADGGFLNCSGVAASRLPAWLRQVAQLVLPRPLYAATTFFGGGVGGLASEFSPFGPVDPAVSYSGGVGGLASEFSVTRGTAVSASQAPSASIPMPSVSPVAHLNALSAACPPVEATAGTDVSPECRPVVTISTRNGTLLQNVPVGWAVSTGGGVVAPSSPPGGTCGAYGPSAATTTDAFGKAGVCWTLGPSAGTNTVFATPTAGGDAPNGVSFVPAKITFTATGTLLTPTAMANGESATYDGLAHPGSGSCSNGITPALSYGGGAVPVDVGSSTLTVTCAGPSFVSTTATASIVITPALPQISVVCPASVVYTATPQAPCTATVSAPGLTGSLTPSYASNVNTGIATASANQGAGGNYLAASGSMTFTITSAPLTATAGSGTMTYGGSVPSIPCTMSGLLGGDAATVSCTTVVPATLAAGVNVTTPQVLQPDVQNYSVQPQPGTLTVQFTQQDCFASPLASSLDAVNAPQSKGSVIQVRCALVDVTGTPVLTGSGDLIVQDLGPHGVSTPVNVLTRSNAFVASSHGLVYLLDTSDASFVTTHYYRVIAQWNDGSSSTGYLLIR